MGCCAARRPATWSPNPLAGFHEAFFGGWRPVIGDVETSAGAASTKRADGYCCGECASHKQQGCDSCEGKAAEPADSCASGACGLNQYTAGIKLPLRQYAVNAGAVRGSTSRASMDDQASAWAAAAFGGRQAGRVTAIGARGSSTFRRSTAIDLMALSDLDLSQRESDILDVDVRESDGPSAVVEYRAELDAVRAEMARREALDPTARGGGGGGDDYVDDPTDRPLTDAEFQEKKAEIARGVADRLEPGDDPASRARRDAIIAQAITGTLTTFNAYLQREYDAQVTTINAARDVTLQTLRNEDRQREREYRLALANLNSGGGGGGGGGGSAAPIVGVGLLGLLLSGLR